MLDFTIVVGVDHGHLKQLKLTWPTWRRNRPDLLERPMLVFIDRSQLIPADVERVVDHPDLSIVGWPPEPVQYPGTPGDKWTDPQRHKMLSGFVHVAAEHVKTPYWLKLDTDCVAQPSSQRPWYDEAWFDDGPAIVAQKWGFTKPAMQMMDLDCWAAASHLFDSPNLDLEPNEGSSRLSHKRIISWCGFFETEFTCLCSDLAKQTGHTNSMPVASQDGFMWYVARRLGLPIKRVDFKARGWQHFLTRRNIEKHSAEAMR